MAGFRLSEKSQNCTPRAVWDDSGKDFAGWGSIRPPESGGGPDAPVRDSLRPSRCGLVRRLGIGNRWLHPLSLECCLWNWERALFDFMQLVMPRMIFFLFCPHLLEFCPFLLPFRHDAPHFAANIHASGSQRDKQIQTYVHRYRCIISLSDIIYQNIILSK